MNRRSVGRRTSDTLLRRVVELAGIGAWQVEIRQREDFDANPLHWSDEVYGIFGYSPRAFPATNAAFFAHVHPEDVAAIRAALQRSVDTGADYHIEHRIIRSDGHVRIVEELASIEPGDPGTPLKLIGTVVDVTDRRRIEAALRGGDDAGARLLSQIVENSHDAIMSMTLDGVITTWNPAAERVFGWKASEIVGRPAMMLTPPEREEELATSLAHGAKGAALGAFETVRIRRDGSVVDVEISTSPILDADGAVLGVSSIIRDFTEQRRIAAQLRHAQRLESIGRLAGGVAHDFNNLLMAITGYTELVRMDLQPDAPAQDDLQAILASAERGARLTRQLLAFGRRQVLHPVQLDVNRVLREMEGVLRPLTGSAIALRLDFSPAPAVVRADRAQLEQVVVNLVANACDAMARGGVLQISTEMVEVGRDGAVQPPSVSPGTYVRLAVSDTGVGMDPDVQARLFEPFFTTKPRGTSTGLGLASTYGIVQQSGGFITVESVRDEGSTIRIFLPHYAGTTPVDDAPAIGAVQGERVIGTETILLVEDDKSVRASARAVLKRLGYHVLDVEAPSAALELMRERGDEIDVLLTDIVLPEMSGLQLVDRMRALRPDLPVVRMSGFAGDETIAPGVHILQKPFSAETLARAIRGALAT